MKEGENVDHDQQSVENREARAKNVHTERDHRAFLNSFKLLRRECRGSPPPMTNQLFNFFQVRNPASRAHSHAGEAGGGATEFQRARKVVAPQERVGKSGVKHIARPGRIDRFYFKCWGVVEAGAVPSEYAIGAQGRGRQAASKSRGNGRQRNERVALPTEPGMKFLGSYGVIHILK